jgi:hypothetical protein
MKVEFFWADIADLFGTPVPCSIALVGDTNVLKELS